MGTDPEESAYDPANLNTGQMVGHVEYEYAGRLKRKKKIAFGFCLERAHPKKHKKKR